jgi:hypothetical protein
MAIVPAAMQPPFFDAVAGATSTPNREADLVATALTPWLEARERALA